MDEDQEIREFQREYTEFLDDKVSKLVAAVVMRVCDRMIKDCTTLEYETSYGRTRCD